jgi:hypothetical protein
MVPNIICIKHDTCMLMHVIYIYTLEKYLKVFICIDVYGYIHVEKYTCMDV